MAVSTLGIEVKPIVSIDGLHHLNEVYFTDVSVPIINRIGEENKGWTYAKYLLGHERTTIANIPANKMLIDAMRRFAATEPDGAGEPLANDAGFVAKLDELEIEVNALECNQSRILVSIASGGSAGDAASMLKILGSEIQQRLEQLRVEAVAYHALALDTGKIGCETNEPTFGPEFATGAVSDYNFGRASSIYGGSNQIQKGVLAKAVLGI